MDFWRGGVYQNYQGAGNGIKWRTGNSAWWYPSVLAISDRAAAFYTDIRDGAGTAFLPGSVSRGYGMSIRCATNIEPRTPSIRASRINVTVNRLAYVDGEITSSIS